MEPSEFEHTVVKGSHVVSAGTLEEIFETPKPKFAPPDFSREMSELHLHIFNVQQQLGKWKELKTDKIFDEFDTQALAIADLKEEYVERKKGLAANVREFVSRYITTDEPPQDSADWKASCNGIISKFKENFDFLANSAKFSESSFMSIHRFVRTISDPTPILEACLALCLNQLEVLKVAQDQLSIASTLLSEPRATPLPLPSLLPSSNPSSSDLLRLKEELEKANEQYSKYQNEMSEFRSRMEIELRKREEAIRSRFNAQQLELQSQFDHRLAAQEEEIASLLQTVREMRQQRCELEESGKLLVVEASRRREIEEKYRCVVSELSEVDSKMKQEQRKAEEALEKYMFIEDQMKRSDESNRAAVALLEDRLKTLSSQLKLAEYELTCRPPVDLTLLAGRIGVALESSSSSSHLSLLSKASWPEIEKFLVEQLRRTEAEASECRVRVQDLTHRLEENSKELSSLQMKYNDKCSVVVSLEKDLLIAHRTVEAGSAMLKSFQTKGHGAQASFWPVKSHGECVSSSASTVGPSLANSKLASLSITNPEIDTETPAGNTHVVLSSLDSSDRMVQAIQSQRDRYMKTAQEKEQELNALKNRFDRLHEDFNILKGENVELFRRLRCLRVASSNRSMGSNDDTGATVAAVGGLTTIFVRGKKDRTNNLDGLESKYLQIYEETIDPFRLEELDRERMTSQLNVVERCLSYVTKMLLQDSWTRHTLVIYLCLVHLFALIYVFQVLNPQLVEEIDSQQREKWAAETLQMSMETEHPDARF